MSYADQSRRNTPTALIAVVGIHAAIGYALISGFAYEVIRHVPGITSVDLIKDVPPPPPKAEPMPKQPVQKTTEVQRPTFDEPKVDLQNPVDTTSGPTTIEIPPISGGGGLIPPPLPPKADLSSYARPAGDRAAWITTDDYPTAALRQNMQGLVVISVSILASGRVGSCLVTQSSGSQILDDATCRLYSKRARFAPARDTDGNPTAAQRTDRYRWQIPSE